jgi:hypothetical protein
MPAGGITEVYLPDPKDVRIAELEARLRAFEEAKAR